MAEKIGLEAVFDLGNFNKGLSGYTGGLGKAEGATNKFTGAVGKGWTDLGSTATKAATIMGGAIVAAAAAAGAAIVGFTVNSITKAADLEQQISNIASALNMTAEEAAPIKNLISELGLDPHLKVSAMEAADAIENLARNGLSMQQILDGGARSVVLLANATGADFGQAADIATDVMAQFNFKAEEMIDVVNGITAVTGLSKFTIDDYALAISQAGGVASDFGVSFDDFNTALVATSSAFASGSDAGTSYKTFLTRLAPSTAAAATAQKKLGLDFFDANGAMKSQAEIAEELNEAFFQEVTFSTQVSNATAEQTAQRKLLERTINSTNMELFKYQTGINGVAQSEADKVVSIDRLNKQHEAAITAYGGLATSMGTTVTTTRKLTEEERILYANTIFGADAMRTMFGMAEAGGVIYTDVATAAAELGVSQAEVNKVIEGGVTKFEALQLQMAQIDAEKQAAVRMQNFKGVLEILGGVIEAIQIQIGDLFLPILTELATKFGELASQYGPKVVAFFQGMSSDISALINWIVAVVEDGDTMNDWLTHMSPPLYAVVRGLDEFVLVMGGLSLLISSTIGTFVEWKDVLIVLGAAILTTVVPALYAMLAAAAPVILVFAGAVLAVAALRTAWEADFLSIRTTTLEAFGAIQTAIAPLTAAIAQFGVGALTEIKAFVTGNQTEFTNLSAIWEGAKQAANKLFVGITGFVSSFLPTWIAKLTEWGTAASQWIVAAVPIVQAKLGEWWTAIQSVIVANLPAFKTTLTEWATAAWQWIVDAAGQVAAKLGEWWAKISAYVTSQLPTWKATLVEWTTAAWEWISKAVAPMLSAIGAFASSLISAISARLPGWIAAFTAWTTAAWQWIAKTVPLAVAQVGVWATRTIGAVAEKLPGWIAGFLRWAQEMVVWIAPAATQAAAAIATWAGQLVGHLAKNLPKWIAGFLKWATAMVTWVASKEADILPHLGTWLGKLLGWMVLAGASIGVKTIEWGIALVSWIATDAVPQLGPNLASFGAALLSGLGTVAVGLYGFLRNMVAEMFNVISTGADWNAVGQEILNKVRTGFESVRESIYNGVTLLVSRIKDFFDLESWTEIGSTILENVKSGFNSIISSFLSMVSTFISNMVAKFTEQDWGQIGSDIIDGILKGLKDNADAVLDYLSELAENALGVVADALGIESPSKEFAKIGRNMMEGWIVGIEQNSGSLYRTIDRITGRILSTVRQTSASAVGLFSSLAGDFLSASNPFADRAGERKLGAPRFQAQALADYNRIQQTYDLLKSQSDLIETIRESGGDVANLLGHMQLGRNADPALILQMVNKASEQFVNNLERSIQVASKGYDQIINSLRGQRRSVEDVEADFQAQHLTGLEDFEKRILDIDQRIVGAENDLLTYGGSERVTVLNQLHQFRQRTVADMTKYLEQWRLLNLKLERIQTSDNERAKTAIEQFRATMIDPLVTQFQNPMTDASGRDSLLRTIDQRNQSISTYIASLGKVTDIEKRFAHFAESEEVSEEFKRAAATMIDALYRVDLAGRDVVIDATSKWLANAEQAFELFNKVAGDDPLLQKVKEGIKPLLQQLMAVNMLTADRTRLTRDLNIAIGNMMAIESNQAQANAIQERIDLVERVRKLGADLKDFNLFGRVFSGIDLTKNLSPQDLAKVLGRYTNEAIRLANQQLTEAIRPRVDVQSQLDFLRRGRETFEQIADDFTPHTYSQTADFQSLLTRIDAQITGLETSALESGSQTVVNQIKDLTDYRRQIVDQTRTYLWQVYQADRIVANIRTTTSEQGSQAVEAFKAKFIDPMIAQIDTFGTAISRANLINRLNTQVGVLNTFISRINQLAAIQKSMEAKPTVIESMMERFFNVDTSDQDRQGIIRYMDQLRQLTAIQQTASKEIEALPADAKKKLEDFIALFDNLLVPNPEFVRGRMLTMLRSYAAQLSQIKDLQKDVSGATGFSPLLARFEEQRLNAVLEKIQDINTGEAERTRLIQQYRMEQEKLLVIQQKTQQLTFLKDQLSLLDEIKSLNEKFGEQVSISDILSGIEFGINASMDDMLLFTSRAIDAMIKTTKSQLGIASPSKVFAEIGEYMMQGLGQGITNAAQYPTMAMAAVTAQQVPYSVSNSRSVSVNMGGVQISNGMDERMFDARVRRIVEGMV